MNVGKINILFRSSLIFLYLWRLYYKMKRGNSTFLQTTFAVNTINI